MRKKIRLIDHVPMLLKTSEPGKMFDMTSYHKQLVRYICTSDLIAVVGIGAMCLMIAKACDNHEARIKKLEKEAEKGE